MRRFIQYYRVFFISNFENLVCFVLYLAMNLSKLIIKYSQNKICTVCLSIFESPVGKMVLAADDEFVYLVAFEDSKNFDKMFQNLSKELSCCFVESTNNVLKLLQEELSDYFDGKAKKFSVPLKTFGSDFQKEVWEKLIELPYGSTQSYGDLAKAMGRSASYARAIGAACGANAHLIVIPCHRLVGSNNKGGFSCGINRKDWLLEHEKKNAEG
ncbi:methylated-DNA--protein-cysteine methyltransferase, inducible [Manduca sexta]|uniref:Methylated-DNA--protein-cysteine methyltransferase n=1 Tax=Manduca sexta TaxID=7130 RepID=A0A921Z7H1_MANSE|nr:methylated-DNA--protein-cysteine methyltransferase, inducible [Manduca sexta]KAG6452761.1 hypothetical protein O3G_MSEX007784 [Manduca sexta]